MNIKSSSILISLFFFPQFVSANQTVSFENDIIPIFKEKCFKCHSDEKQKGDLRLDGPEWILDGSENGSVLTPYYPEDSSIYVLTTLPDYDIDYMPSKGEGLNKSEQETLKKWIMQGAKFEEGSKKPVVATKGINDQKADRAALPIFSSNFDKIKRKKLETLGAQLIVRQHEISVDLRYCNVEKLPEVISELVATSANNKDYKFSIDLSRQKISDDIFASLKLNSLSQIQAINLSNTDISDKSTKQLKDLSQLEYLNLYATKVSDNGVVNLTSLNNLKELYIWQSKVSLKGAKSLKTKMPNTKIVFGTF